MTSGYRQLELEADNGNVQALIGLVRATREDVAADEYVPDTRVLFYRIKGLYE